MAIDMTTVKQIMHGNKEVLKIEDGHGILWQKPSVEKQITITYLMGFYTGQTPATKTVTTTGGVYALTSADLPTLNLATGYTTTGWTLDGSTALTAGATISDNVTLLAIQKVKVSKTYDWHHMSGMGEVSTGGKTSITSDTQSHSTSLWNLSTAAAGTYKCSYSKTWSGLQKYTTYHYSIGIRGFNGVVVNFQVATGRKFKIHWNPAVRSVTYAATSSHSIDGNYSGAYPMILVRNGNTTTKLYTNDNVAANFVSSTITAGSSANAYIGVQYGGWNANGGGKTAWARQNICKTGTLTSNYPSSNKTGNITDNIYIYIQP